MNRRAEVQQDDRLTSLSSEFMRPYLGAAVYLHISLLVEGKTSKGGMLKGVKSV